MTCPKCSLAINLKISDAKPKSCPHCGIFFRKFGEAKWAQKSHSQPEAGDAPPVRAKNSWSWIWLLALVGIGAYAYQSLQGGGALIASFSSRDPAAIENKTAVGCAGKEKCVVVFVAPWCSVCEQTLPAIQAISQKWEAQGQESKIGLRVVVGQDTSEKCEKLARRIGPYAATDPNDGLFKQHQITAFPTWIVFDSLGHELLRLSAGIPDSSYADTFVKQALKL